MQQEKFSSSEDWMCPYNVTECLVKNTEHAENGETEQPHSPYQLSLKPLNFYV